MHLKYISIKTLTVIFLLLSIPAQAQTQTQAWNCPSVAENNKGMEIYGKPKGPLLQAFVYEDEEIDDEIFIEIPPTRIKTDYVKTQDVWEIDNQILVICNYRDGSLRKIIKNVTECRQTFLPKKTTFQCK